MNFGIHNYIVFYCNVHLAIYSLFYNKGALLLKISRKYAVARQIFYFIWLLEEFFRLNTLRFHRSISSTFLSGLEQLLLRYALEAFTVVYYVSVFLMIKPLESYFFLKPLQTDDS